MTRRVSFSPDMPSTTSQPLYFTRHDNKVKRNNNMPEQPVIRIWAFKPQKHSTSYSAMRFLGRIKAKFARVLGFVSTSRKISSSSSSANDSSCSCNCESLVRSRSYVEALDSHRAQAIEDCIQFLNSSSSSSFQRSKSLSSFSY